VTVVERTGSTMEDCRALGEAGAPTGTAVLAGWQERGRGRAPGRRWLSPPWESLLVTVLLRPGDAAGTPRGLPLRAGLAVCRAIGDATGATAEIRWPNDALLGGRKVAGVLCEAHGPFLLVGIGVNCLQRSFPPEIENRAVSLLAATGRAVDPRELCPLVLSRLREALEEPGWREEVERRLAGRGRRTRVEPVGTGSALEGVVLGIDGEGALLLRGDDGVMRRAGQGEISGGR
jgi:BirA family biotin operon repressor/biotin-[acetyl-CoA-carboxylase] ligase